MTCQGQDEAVVVPATGAPSVVTALRSLRRRGVRTVVPAERANRPALRSNYCDEWVPVPSPEDALTGYGNALLSLARRPAVRTILPMREADAYVLARNREAFGEHVATPWPTFEALRTVHDRIELVEAAATAGVAAPETRPLSAVETCDRRSIVKSRYAILTDAYHGEAPPGRGVEPSGVHYLDAGESPDEAALNEEFGHDPIVQEYVPGEEYSFWALYDEGEAVATCHKRQHRAWSYTGGTSICRETVDIPRLEAVGRRLLDQLDWHGLAAVQFQRDADTGEFVLLEVNPRIWISLSAAVRAGADFPYYYWRLAADDPAQDAGYETGVVTHLPRGELSYLASVLADGESYVDRPPADAALWAVASSFVEHPQFDYFSADDPRPYARSVLNAARRRIG